MKPPSTEARPLESGPPRTRVQLAGTADGRLPQHERVDEREDRGIRADAEREREDRNECEARASADAAHGIAEVGGTLVEEPHAERGAAVFLLRLDRAELDPRAPARLCWSHTAADEIVGERVDMEPEFVGHLAFERRAAKNSVKPHADAR